MTNNHTEQRNLLLDCDGVLLNWLKGFILYAETRLDKTLDTNGPASFDLTEWLGVSGSTLGSMITDFNSGAGGHFGRLEPLPGAVEALHAAHAQGREISIITACSVTREVISQRKQNLISVFGDIFKTIDCVDMNASKRELLESYSDVAWVEDKTENALMGAQVGHPTYLISQSYNLHQQDSMTHPLMTTVQGWSCIREHEGL